jgi:peptide/nickel transport system substrate-binding protein
MVNFNKKKWMSIITTVVAIYLVGAFIATQCLAEKPEGQITLALVDTFNTKGLDILTANGGGAMVIHSLFFDSLIIRRGDGKIYPAIAKSWEIAKDWSYIKFTLDETARFHNGNPVRAEDVKFSIERASDPKMGFIAGGEFRRSIKNIEVIDDYHLVMYVNNPFPSFFDRCAEFFGIVPKDYIEKVGDAEFAKHPIGAGPFRCIEFQQDVYIKAEAVEDHYRKPPEVKTLILKVVPEHSTRLAMLQTGEADIIRVQPEHLSTVKNDSKLRVIMLKYVNCRNITFFDLAFPDDPSPWHDIRVRKAASYAINRKAISEIILQGTAEPWGNLLAPYNLGYDSSVKPFPYDPEKAKKLLSEAGYPNGFDTTFTASTKFKQESEAIVANLNSVGIRAKLKIYEQSVWIREMVEHKLRGIGDHPVPFWAGRSLAAFLQSTLSSDSKWTYVTSEEAESYLHKINDATDNEIIAATARELSHKYPEWMFRALTWAKHTTYAVGPRIQDWGPIPGRQFVSRFETIKLE